MERYLGDFYRFYRSLQKLCSCSSVGQLVLRNGCSGEAQEHHRAQVVPSATHPTALLTDARKKPNQPPQKHHQTQTSSPPPSQFSYFPGKAGPCGVHLRVKKKGSLNYLRDSKIWMTILSATYGSRGYFIQAKTTC